MDPSGRFIQILLAAGGGALAGGAGGFFGSLLAGESLGDAAIRGMIGAVSGALGGIMASIGIPPNIAQNIAGAIDAALNGAFDLYKRLGNRADCDFTVEQVLQYLMRQALMGLVGGAAGKAVGKLLKHLGICRRLGKIACAGVQMAAPIAGSTMASAAMGNCFVAGTPVLMADGTTKPIEEIEVGDEVLTRDENDPDAPATVGKVVRLFRSVTAEGTLTIAWSDPADSPAAARDVATGSHSVTTTPGHVWYVHGRGWIHARWIMNGDVLKTADGRYVVVREVRFDPTPVEVFNFEVARTHTYHVGGASEPFVLVHNGSEDDALRMAGFGDDVVAKTNLLQQITSQVAAQVDELGDDAFTPRQLAAIRKYPKLRPMFRGWQIDKRVRAVVANQPELRGFRGSPSKGPDFRHRRHKGKWWDMTTEKAWGAHVDKYGPGGELLDTERKPSFDCGD